MPSSGGQTCALDRKSTRLNSSHTIISYAVFCLKKERHRTRARTSQRPEPVHSRRAHSFRCPPRRQERRTRAARKLHFFLNGPAPPETPPFPPQVAFRI